MTERRPDSNRAHGCLIPGVIGLAVLAAGGAFIYEQLPHLPHVVASPKDSKIEATELDLVAAPRDCLNIGVWDVKGSQARTQLSIPGTAAYIGRGAVVEQGLVEDTTCIASGGVTFKTSRVNGTWVKLVIMKRSAFEREAHFYTKDTDIESIPEPANQALTGVIDIASALSRTACTAASELFHKDGVTVEGHKLTCDTLDGLAEMNDEQDTQIKTALQADIESYVQVQGGISSWPAQKASYLDAYKIEARQQGKPANILRLEIVDDNGRPTNQAPDFKKSVDQIEIDRGFLSATTPGPKLEFDKKVAIPLSPSSVPQPTSLN